MSKEEAIFASLNTTSLIMKFLISTNLLINQEFDKQIIGEKQIRLNLSCYNMNLLGPYMNREHIRELADFLSDERLLIDNFLPLTEYNFASQVTRFFSFYLSDKVETHERYHELFTLILEEFEIDLMRFIYARDQGVLLPQVHAFPDSTFPHANGVDPVNNRLTNAPVMFR